MNNHIHKTLNKKNKRRIMTLIDIEINFVVSEMHKLVIYENISNIKDAILIHYF